MPLPHLEPTSAAARALRTHITARLADAGASLKVPGCPERAADLLRGRIAELEDLLEVIDADAGADEPHPHAIVP